MQLGNQLQHQAASPGHGLARRIRLSRRSGPHHQYPQRRRGPQRSCRLAGGEQLGIDPARHLRFDGLHQKPLGAFPENLAQRIFALSQWKDSCVNARIVHGSGGCTSRWT